MKAFLTGRIAASVALLASTMIVFDAAAQSAGSTKFRGIALKQSIEEVQKVMASNGFRTQVVDDPDRVWGRDADNTLCGSVEFKDRRAVELRLSPCYFRLDSGISAQDLAQAMVNNFPIKKMDIGSRVQVDMISHPARRYRVTYYHGRLATGENVEIVVNDGRYITQENYEGSSPTVTITSGKSTAAPIFK